MKRIIALVIIIIFSAGIFGIYKYQKSLFEQEELLKQIQPKAALKIGDTVENFILLDAYKKQVSLYTELQKGPVILSFYRGGWCPICNVQLRSFQENLDKIRSYDANLIAISPETPEHGQLTLVKNDLNFPVLHDNQNNLARQYGIIWNVPQDSVEVFAGWLKETTGKTLRDFNDKDGYELPIPATFIINKRGKVVYMFKDPDYRKRANMKEILSVLKNIDKF